MGCHEQAGPFRWSHFASNTKIFSHGYDIFSTVSDMLVNKKELELHICKKDDGWFYKYAFYNVSMKRRNEIKNVLNFRYRKTASSEIPVTDHLIGDNCVSKPKVMGDITKQPIGKKSNYDAKFKNASQAKNYMANLGYQPIQTPYRGKNRQYSSYLSLRGRGQRGHFQYRSAMKMQSSYNKWRWENLRNLTGKNYKRWMKFKYN